MDQITPVKVNKKAARYGWTVRDRPGEFAWIPKGQLQIDHSYQRTETNARALLLAHEWSWIACGALIVALRPSDASWVVIDGQHRKAAADKREDIDLLPCLVFEVDDKVNEAQGFLNSNANRRALTMVEKFKALLMTDDPKARVVDELVLSVGRVVSSGASSRSVSCISTMMRCIRQDEAALRRVWPMIVKLCQGQVIPQDVVAGMFYLETHLRQGTLSSTRWRQRIQSVGLTAIQEAMRKASAFRGGRSPKALGEGLLEALNKGIRVSKLETTFSP